jgi:beta-N-acetylhexosaminidase
MGRHTAVTTALLVAIASITGCGISFDVDPMTNSLDASSTPTPSANAESPVLEVNRPYDPTDPTAWTDRQLVAQTIFECVPVSNVAEASWSVRRGIGGVVFLGGVAPANLKQQISKLSGLAGGKVPPLIASDEEGGVVQRLATAIYPLRSAVVMGRWTDAEVTKTATKYGKAMKRLGVDMAFSPVADLDIDGHFISDQSRAFSSSPAGAARSAIAWATGLDAAGVAPVVKHWPGHGRATDTHRAPGIIPPFSKLLKSDLVPFDRAIDAGFTAVMVGHLESKGLTEPGVPASRSPQALAVLREQIGPDGLIITDSLSMEASLVGVKHKTPEAVLQSLAAGVDVALMCSGPPNLIDRVMSRRSPEELSREDLIAKVTRILAWKKRYGVTG